MAVKIARRKIHFAEEASFTEYFIHEADTFKEFVPIKRGHIAHAGNHVADGNRRCRLLLMLGADDFIRRGALRVQSLIEPKQNGANLGIEVSQALDQLDCKRPIEWFVFKIAQNRGRDRWRISA